MILRITKVTKKEDIRIIIITKISTKRVTTKIENIQEHIEKQRIIIPH